MIINTTYTIGFKMPDEHRELELFQKENDISEWKMDQTTLYIYFTKKEYMVLEK